MKNRNPLSLLFTPHPQLSDSLKRNLITVSQETPVIESTIIEYFEVYVSKNLDRMREKLQPKTIIKILNQSSKMQEEEFSAWLIKNFGEKNQELKKICMVLRRIICGELNEKDPFIITLKKVNPDQPLSIRQYNWLISNKMQSLILAYFGLNSKEFNCIEDRHGANCSLNGSR